MGNKKIFRCGSSCSAIERFDREVIDMYAEAGIDAIEVALPFKKYFDHDWSELGKYARARGVELWSVHLPFGGENNMFNIADRAFSRSTMEADAELLKRAADAGMKAAVIHPNTGDIPEQNREDQMKTSIESLSGLVSIGSRYGVKIAVEILPPDNLGSRAGEMKRITEAVPGLSICMDVNHIIGYSVREFAETFADKIVTVHISDNDLRSERHWMPGRGKLDWADIMSALDDIGYRGPFMYELGGKEFCEAGLSGIRKNYDKFIRKFIDE